MGDVDTTKREVEEHESKQNPHSDSASATAFSDHENAGNPHADSASASDLYTDQQARDATDGQIDAETVDGQHASDLGNHIEAFSGVSTYNTPFSFSTAFSGTPAVTATAVDGGYNEYSNISSVSTTSVSVTRMRNNGSTDSGAVHIIATEP